MISHEDLVKLLLKRNIITRDEAKLPVEEQKPAKGSVMIDGKMVPPHLTDMVLAKQRRDKKKAAEPKA
jgi:hypothetical protein